MSAVEKVQTLLQLSHANSDLDFSLLDRTYRPMVTLRLCQASQNWLLGKPLHWFFRLMHRSACNTAGIDLPWKTKIEGGFALTHGWGVVINPNAIIGKNVTFFNGVTLGQRDRIAKDGKRSTEYPVIEAEVWVGPHAIIVGGVVIGNGYTFSDPDAFFIHLLGYPCTVGISYLPDH